MVNYNKNDASCNAREGSVPGSAKSVTSKNEWLSLLKAPALMESYIGKIVHLIVCTLQYS